MKTHSSRISPKQKIRCVELAQSEERESEIMTKIKCQSAAAKRGVLQRPTLSRGYIGEGSGDCVAREWCGDRRQPAAQFLCVPMKATVAMGRREGGGARVAVG